MKVAIVVPVYNEGKRAIDSVCKILFATKNRIIIVDDGSKDNSLEQLLIEFKDNDRVSIINHVINLGKGAAMTTGVKMAWKLRMEAVIFIDADGQHDPKHLKDFEEALEKTDLVFGYRKLNGEMPFVRKWGNIIAKNIIKTLFNVNRKEFLCGYLGFRKTVYPKIKWKSSRYGVETEIATKVGKNNISFSEVEIDTIYVDKYKGVSIFDALRILTRIPYWYFSK